MTNILHFYGVVRDGSSSVDENSEGSRIPDDQDGSEGNEIGENLFKPAFFSAFPKGCLNFGRLNELASSSSSSSGLKGPSKIGSKTGLPSTPSSLTTTSGERGVEILPSPRSEGEILSSPHLKSFTFSDLKNATRNFRRDSILGEGGFGCVFKGWLNEHTLSVSIPGSGMVVAVKKLKPGSFQGCKEWLAEVNYLGRFHHPNLIKLIGYCLEDENRLLVYEFMPKGGLDNHLFRKGGYHTLSWGRRIKVAIGAARSLSFLHEADPQVIHGDFKASNILVDAEFNPKLSGFELPSAGPIDDAHITHVSLWDKNTYCVPASEYIFLDEYCHTMCFGNMTHVSRSSRGTGTYGYAAPEYIATGHLSVKSDVYSFGVVLLELLSGRRDIDLTKSCVEQKLVEWAKPYLGNKRKLFRIMDPLFECQYPQKGAYVAASLALACLANSAKDRPSMAEVLAVLEQIPDIENTSKQSQ